MSNVAKAIAAILILIAIAPASAESLWSTSSKSIFEDQKARRAGDLLTIVIIEESSSSLAESSDYAKAFEHNNAAGVGPFPINLLPDINFKSAQKGTANGSNTVTSSFATKVTATVIDVLPNGNLVVQASRVVITNGEKQDIVLTGVVRPQDVNQDNSVLSTYLADVVIKFNGKGPIGDRQKEGFFSKLLRYVF